jgi:hypothetical protein
MATPLVRVMDLGVEDSFGTTMFPSSDPLGFGAVQINGAGQVAFTLLGAFPLREYQLSFCPFMQPLTKCAVVGTATTDSSGNGGNVIQWTFSSRQVTGTFLVTWGTDPVYLVYVSGFQVPAGPRASLENVPKLPAPKMEPVRLARRSDQTVQAKGTPRQ